MQARPVGERALALRKKRWGRITRMSRRFSISSRILYDIMGDDVRAEASFQRALNIREKALGPDHPALAQVSITFPHLPDERQLRPG